MAVTCGLKPTKPQSRIKNTICLHHRLCSPHEPKKNGFQHAKTLTEYQKKWHAMCGTMIFWFTRGYCKLSQPFHDRFMKIIMDIYTLLGIFKSLNLQRQTHRLYKYCQLACLAFKFHEPWNEQLTHEDYKTYHFAKAVCQLNKTWNKGLMEYFNFHWRCCLQSLQGASTSSDLDTFCSLRFAEVRKSPSWPAQSL